MLHLFRRIWGDFPHWERPAQLGFVFAVVLLLGSLVLILIAPQEERVRFLLAFGALVLVAQGIVLWANRGMVAPITQAQRAYLRGDFAETVAVLEPLRSAGRADITQLTLLGNTYRQLGRLEDSAQVLSEAVDKAPNHHYSLYGFGRTLIVQGRYEAGANYVLRALEAGAPAIVKFDLCEAFYRSGRLDDVRVMLPELQDEEPHRTLILALWRYQMGDGEYPSSGQISAGLSYWQAQAERFATTPYGQAVAAEVIQMRT